LFWYQSKANERWRTNMRYKGLNKYKVVAESLLILLLVVYQRGHSYGFKGQGELCENTAGTYN
jgi:hypothetical protein